MGVSAVYTNQLHANFENRSFPSCLSLLPVASEKKALDQNHSKECVFSIQVPALSRKKKTTQFHMKSFVRGLVLKTRHVVRSNSNMANWLWCFKVKATTIKWPTTTSVSKHNELTRNRPFPGSLVSLFQNESKCETFHMKMSSARAVLFSCKSNSFS